MACVMIANAIINSPFRSKIPELDRIANLLTPPFDQNHSPSHSAISHITSREATAMVEVFDFDSAETAHVDELVWTKGCLDDALKNCFPPRPRMLIQFVKHERPYAIFAEGERENVRLICFSRSGFPIAEITASFDDPDLSMVHHPRSGKDGRPLPCPPAEVCQVLFWTVAMVWRSLTESRSTITREITREGRLHKRYSRRCLMGINSVNRCSLNLPRSASVRSRVRFVRGSGVREHSVMGYENKFGTRVDGYTRGDPKLGSIIKLREVHFS